MARKPMSRFTSLTENEALKEAVIARIQRRGPITFRDFMEVALYHPQLGYYCSPREKMGHQGDYLTSPEVSPLFGDLVACQIEEMWEILGRPTPFFLMEMGAGSGALAQDLLAWARHHAPSLWQALSYHIVEVSPELTRQQAQRFQAIDPALAKVSWSTSPPSAIEGCILSNELVDSFPVHRVTVRSGRLLEVYVGCDGTRFREELKPPSTPALERYFRRLGLWPGEGCYAEVNLQAPAWLAQVAQALRRGFLHTFDYGYEATELYAPWRQEGTLLCFYRHNPSSNPYARLGRQDMTSHVDLTTLKLTASKNGLELVGIITQAQFLSNLGIAQALPASDEGHLDLEEYCARRRAIVELTDAAGLGRIKVMIHSKGVSPCHLSGLGEDHHEY
jgi:SAM-dependent MidA family methyltransferase